MDPYDLRGIIDHIVEFIITIIHIDQPCKTHKSLPLTVEVNIEQEQLQQVVFVLQSSWATYKTLNGTPSWNVVSSFLNTAIVGTLAYVKVRQKAR